VPINPPNNGVSSAAFRRRFLLFLLPGLYQSALPFLMLPLTTKILGPADFALFSVANAISALLTTIAQLGSGFILAQRFATSHGDERRRLISTIFFQNLAVSALCALLILTMWPVVRGHWSVAGGITVEMMGLMMVAMIASSLYTLIGTLAIFGHAAGYFSLMTIVKATVSVAVVLLALFVFHLEVLSLFLGQFAAGLFELIASASILLPFLAWRYDRKVAHDCVVLGGWNSVAQLTMQGRQLLERSVLSTAVGLNDLGLFVHAQQYQNYAMLGVRPIQQAVTPIMLEEAGEPVAEFGRTGRVNRVLFAALTMLALTFAFLGNEFIHIMTNGKFDAAAPYAALLIAALLLQSAGRPQFGRLMAEGRGRYLSAANIAAVAGAAALLVTLAPYFGLAAAVAAIYLQYVLFRAAIELDALRSGRLPFQDWPGVVGIALVGAAAAAVEIWHPDLLIRGTLLLAGLILTAAFNRSVIYDMIGQVRTLWCSLRGRATAVTMPANRYRQYEGREP